MRSKRGSTLLLTICLFMVFLIFAAALIPLSRRAFQQTAADVTQQQADYIAQSAVEALITQLDEESLRQTLIEVVEGSKDQVVSDWASYGDHGEYRYTVTRDAFYNESHDRLLWSKSRIFITAEAKYEDKTSQMTAVVQATKYMNQFFDPNGIEREIASKDSLSKRAVLINECRIPTDHSASFWINAISDLTVTQQNVNGNISSEDEKIDDLQKNLDPKVVLIYRNIKNPVVTGHIDGNVVLEPAEYTKATIGSDTLGEVVIDGDVICKGDLVLKNATVTGAIYYTGSFKPVNASYTGEIRQIQPTDALFEKYMFNLPLIPRKIESIEGYRKVTSSDDNIDIKITDDSAIFYEFSNPNLEKLQIKNGKLLDISFVNLAKMPNQLIVESENKFYRPVFFIEDENPVLSDQVSTNLLNSENIILVFTHPVRIQGDVNVSVFAPKIIFEAENITMNGRLQACEFEHSELVSSVNLKARNNADIYEVFKLGGAEAYYFDLYYYQP